nr:MFS transporter [Acidithiobacillus thiooxidans]
MTGIALPLIVRDFTLQAAQKGVVTAVALFGILIGATMLGGLSDIFGRKRMFIAEMVIFVVFLIGLTLSPSYLWMVICLFGIGLALGCDYPTAHLVISEAVPSKGRGGLVLGAFAFQAVGAIVGAGLGIIILDVYPEVDAWRWMYAAAVIPAILVIVGRFLSPTAPTGWPARGVWKKRKRKPAACSSGFPNTPRKWSSTENTPIITRKSVLLCSSTTKTGAPLSSPPSPGSFRI